MNRGERRPFGRGCWRDEAAWVSSRARVESRWGGSAMPMHDWTRVDPNDYHDFHGAWIYALRTALNNGLLPAGYFALAEHTTPPIIPDVVTLSLPDDPPPPLPRPADDDGAGGVAVAAPPTTIVAT